MTIFGRSIIGVPLSSGSLIFGDDGTTKELSIGAEDQILSVNSDGTPYWKTLVTANSLLNTGPYTLGQMLYYDGSEFINIPNFKLNITGDDQIQFQVSNDGTNFTNAINITDSGSVTFPNSTPNALTTDDLANLDAAIRTRTNSFTNSQNFTDIVLTGKAEIGTTDYNQDSIEFATDQAKIKMSSLESLTYSQLSLRSLGFQPPVDNFTPPTPPQILNLDLTFDYVVDPATGDDANDGSPASPFETIAGLRAALTATSSGNTSTALIKAATYTDEHLNLSTMAGTATVVCEAGVIFNWTSGGTAISALTHGNIATGRLNFYGNGALVRGFNGANSEGISGNNGTTVIYDTMFTDCTDGINSAGSSTIEAYRCTIVNCGTRNIVTSSSSSITVENCYIETKDGQAQVVSILSTGTNIIRNSLLVRPAGASRPKVQGNENNLTIQNSIIGSPTLDIEFQGATRVENSFVNGYVQTNNSHEFLKCFGRLNLRMRDGNNSPLKETKVTDCVLVGDGTSEFIQTNYTPTQFHRATVRNTVVINYALVIEFNNSATNRGNWQTSGSTVDNCAFFDNVSLYGTEAANEVGSTITNIITSNPGLVTANLKNNQTQVMSDYAITDVNYGFTVAESQAVGFNTQGSSLQMDDSTILTKDTLNLGTSGSVNLGSVSKFDTNDVVFGNGKSVKQLGPHHIREIPSDYSWAGIVPTICTTTGQCQYSNDISRYAKDTHSADIVAGEIWVDPVNGDDANAGTELAPVQTLNYALKTLTPSQIFCLPGEYEQFDFRTTDSTSSTLKILTALGPCKLKLPADDVTSLTWTQDSTYSTVYYVDTTASYKDVRYLLDFSRIDEYGQPVSLPVYSSLVNLDAYAFGSGFFFDDANNRLYVKYSTGIDVNTVKAKLQAVTADFGDRNLVFGTKVLMEGDWICEGLGMQAIQSSSTRAYLYMDLNNREEPNIRYAGRQGFLSQGATVYIKNVWCHRNQRSNFQYGANGGVLSYGVEIDCVSTYAGNPEGFPEDATAWQGSVVTGDTSLIRMNSILEYNKTVNISDSDSKTWNIGVQSSRCFDTNGVGFLITESDVILDSCNAFANELYDIQIATSGTLQRYATAYQTQDVSSGTVTETDFIV